jgi:hypothetical protein
VSPVSPQGCVPGVSGVLKKSRAHQSQDHQKQHDCPQSFAIPLECSVGMWDATRTAGDTPLGTKRGRTATGTYHTAPRTGIRFVITAIPDWPQGCVPRCLTPDVSSVSAHIQGLSLKAGQAIETDQSELTRMSSLAGREVPYMAGMSHLANYTLVFHPPQCKSRLPSHLKKTNYVGRSFRTQERPRSGNRSCIPVQPPGGPMSCGCPQSGRNLHATGTETGKLPVFRQPGYWITRVSAAEC